MRFGWVLNDTVKARLREIARNDPECYVYGNPYGNGFDDDATDSDLGCPPGLSGIPRARVDDYCTMDLAAESVLRALGISLRTAWTGGQSSVVARIGIPVGQRVNQVSPL